MSKLSEYYKLIAFDVEKAKTPANPDGLDVVTEDGTPVTIALTNYNCCCSKNLPKHNIIASKDEMLMIGDASGKEGQFSDSDRKTAENFGIDYFDVKDFIQFVELNKCNTKL